jgi:phosphate transport system substrate-binding protein
LVNIPIMVRLKQRVGLVLALYSAMALSAPVFAQERVRLTGSGASFPYPIYATWFKTFSREHPRINVNYQAKGSGAGVRDFVNGTVDFAGSDAALTDDEIAEVGVEVLMLPLTAGAIVLAYNLPGIETPLRLSRSVYPAIFLGEIARWNDERIAQSNPGVTLPDLPITLVRRADSSGTTFAFTNHLAAISSAWRDGPGVGKSVVWPSLDRFIAAPKNDGVTATIMQTPGALGYVEYGFARQARLAVAALENASGTFVEPALASGLAALEAGPIPEDLRIWIPDPASSDAYPIVTYSWLLVRAAQGQPARAHALQTLIEYCVSDGQDVADAMGYIPLPDTIVEQVRARVARLQ